MTTPPPSSEIREILHEFAIEYSAESRESRMKCLDEVMQKLGIHSLESRLKTLEEEHGMMKKALSFPDGIHIRVNFTGCHTEASFHAAIKAAGSDLELQKEQVLYSLSSK